MGYLKVLLSKILLLLGIVTTGYISEADIVIHGDYGSKELGIVDKNSTLYAKVLNTHIQELVNMGFNYEEDFIEDVEFRVDMTHITEGRGGYYAEKGVEYVDHSAYEKHVVVVYGRDILKGIEKDLTYSILHELGHYVGHKYTHVNDNFERFNAIRGGDSYEVTESQGYYPMSWRNSIYEQYADTYAEVFIRGYTNVTASPELTKKQVKLFKNDIVNTLNDYYSNRK